MASIVASTPIARLPCATNSATAGMSARKPVAAVTRVPCNHVFFPQDRQTVSMGFARANNKRSALRPLYASEVRRLRDRQIRDVCGTGRDFGWRDQIMNCNRIGEKIQSTFIMSDIS